jgi:hypothetical protein
MAQVPALAALAEHPPWAPLVEHQRAAVGVLEPEITGEGMAVTANNGTRRTVSAAVAAGLARERHRAATAATAANTAAARAVAVWAPRLATRARRGTA